jgi:hypothetical protein
LGRFSDDPRQDTGFTQWGPTGYTLPIPLGGSFDHRRENRAGVRVQTERQEFVWPPYAVRACVANPVNFRLRQDLKCKSICIHSHPTGPPHGVFQPVGTRQQRDKSTCPSTHLTIRPTVEATPILPVRRVSNVCGFGILGNREHACQAGAFGLCG